MDLTDYASLLKAKTLVPTRPSIDTDVDVQGNLFEFQKAIIKWAIAQKRAAIFAATGLGKSYSLGAYADAIVRRDPNACVVVLTPLCTAKQLVREAQSIGIATPISYVRVMPSDKERKGRIFVTNYDIAHKFELQKFTGLILDESSILKHKDCKTSEYIIESCKGIEYKLCLSATPAPNTFSELLQQAAALEIATYDFLVSTFFQKGTDRSITLRPAAMKPFVAWLSTWSVWLDSPADLGFVDEAKLFELPKLHMIYRNVASDVEHDPSGKGLTNRLKARKLTLNDRVQYAAKLIAEDPDQTSPWIVWTSLNEESARLVDAIPGAVQIVGSDSIAKKETALEKFAAGDIRVLITKAQITGWGLNWQFCHKSIFIGLTDSYESIYQSVRRTWRFGQKREVYAHLLTTDAEKLVEENVRRKDAEVTYLKSLMRERMALLWDRDGYRGPPPAPKDIDVLGTIFPETTTASGARMINGDCITAMNGLEENSVDYSVFSPPFSALYRYSDDPRDLSNCLTEETFVAHMTHFGRSLHRVLKPGRLVTMHCMNIPLTKTQNGIASIRDLRSEISRAMQSAGFLLHAEIAVYRCPVQAMVRTKAPGLFHKQYLKDASVCRQSLPDYLLTFKKRGDNAVPITHAPDMELWKKLAACVWHVEHHRTLNVKKLLKEFAALEIDSTSEDEVAPDDDADADPPAVDAAPVEGAKHPTPLQLPLIRDCIGLWSNPGEMVLCPFSGYGSVGHIAKELGRKFVGIELNQTYYKASLAFI